MKQTRLFSGLLAMLMTCFVSNAFGATDETQTSLEFANIKAFVESPDVTSSKASANLTLTNATVQFVHGSSVYVTEETDGQVYGCVLKNLKGQERASKIVAGDILSGTIITDYTKDKTSGAKKDDGIRMLYCNQTGTSFSENWTIKTGNDTPTPTEASIKDFKTVFQYIKTPVSVKTASDNGTFIIAPDGYGFAKVSDILEKTDQFTDGAQGMVEGVLVAEIDAENSYNNKYFFCPIKNEVTEFTEEQKKNYLLLETVTEGGKDYVYLNEYVDYTPKAKENANVKLYRYFQPNGVWATLILPFDMSYSKLKDVFGKDVVLAEFSDRSTDSRLVFNKITEENGLKAHVPYIARGITCTSDNIYYIEGVNITEHTGDLKKTVGIWTMTGTYSTILCETLDPKTDYTISQNQFNTPGAGTPPINGFRAYLTNTSNTSSKEVPFIVEDETTGISELMTRDMISDTFDVYNVNGQLVRANATSLNGLHKGLYIVNGKKYVVK